MASAGSATGAVRALAPTVVPQTGRVTYLHSLYTKLRESFNFTTLPPNVLITCGWPSRRARGAATSRLPVEFLAGEWRNNDNEAAFLSVHPERMRTAEVAAISVLHGLAIQFGGRTAAQDIGLVHNKLTGEVEILDTQAGQRTSALVLDAIRSLPALPTGFAEMPEPAPRKAQSNRQRKWICSVPGCKMPPVRIASDTVGVELSHNIHRPYAPLVLVKPEDEAGQAQANAANGNETLTDAQTEKRARGGKGKGKGTKRGSGSTGSGSTITTEKATGRKVTHHTIHLDEGVAHTRHAS